MTLQQLKYAVAVADTRNITEASRRVFVSQPSLTAAIRELEQEMGITIFSRSNKGVTITNEGDEFLSYARQVLEQASLLEDRFKGGVSGNTIFSVFRALRARLRQPAIICGKRTNVPISCGHSSTI